MLEEPKSGAGFVNEHQSGLEQCVGQPQQKRKREKKMMLNLDADEAEEEGEKGN